MPQAYPYLALTDGTDTVVFQDGLGGTPAWPLAKDGWAPAVAGLDRSLLGGRGPYADVEETITCNIIGATASACYANLETLARLLDKADRWWMRGEQLSPVILQYAPQGSNVATTAAPLQALVVGRSGSTNLSGVALPASTADLTGVLYEIYGVDIGLIRRGAFLQAAVTASSAASAMPAILTATFAGATTLYSPTKLTLSGALVRTVRNVQYGYLLLAPANRIEITEGEATSNTGAGVTAITADAAAHASGGSVMRMSTAVAGYQMAAAYTAPFAALAYQVAVFAVVRVNGAGTLTSPISMQLLTFQRTAISGAPAVSVDSNNFLPQIVSLGTVSSRLPTTAFMLDISWLDGTHVTSVDIDYVVSIALNNSEDARVLAFTIDQSNTMFSGVTSTNTVAVVVDPAALAAPAPFVQANQSGGTSEPWSWGGDAYLSTKEAAVTACYIATFQSNWRPWDTTAAALISFSIALSRQPATLTPQ